MGLVSVTWLQITAANVKIVGEVNRIFFVCVPGVIFDMCAMFKIQTVSIF